MTFQLQILLFLGIITCCFGLECYVCNGQFNNKDKCIKSSVQCTQSQDTCLTHIRWQAPEFWTPRSEKIHIIGKQCATLSACNHLKRSVGLHCMRDWYRNWECYECCQGDRCNYYVTGLALGAMCMGELLLFAQSLSNSLHLPPRVRGGPSLAPAVLPQASAFCWERWHWCGC